LDTRDLSAIIVHFRTPGETLRAARAVAASVPDAELIVVDNASGDDVAQILGREVPSARLLAEPENRGYGAACNRGAEAATGKWLLFLNSDAFLQPGCAGILVEALEADPRAAVAGPLLRYEDGTLQPSIQRLPTPWRIFCESSGLAALAGGRGPLSGHTRTRQDHARLRAVEALMGAVLLVRRSAFEEVGGFDEDFFLYAEETDLMARLRARGWRILFVPGAVALHAGGASGGDMLFGQLHGSMTRYVRKHHGRAAALFSSVVLRAGAAARYAAALVTPGERGRRRRVRYRAAIRR
jgi:GT2 family glycosyltransferase